MFEVIFGLDIHKFDGGISYKQDSLSSCSPSEWCAIMKMAFHFFQHLIANHFIISIINLTANLLSRHYYMYNYFTKTSAVKVHQV